MSSDSYVSINGVPAESLETLKAILKDSDLLERAELHEEGAYLPDLHSNRITDLLESLAEQKIKADGYIHYDSVDAETEHFVIHEHQPGEWKVEYMAASVYAANIVFGNVIAEIEKGADLDAVKEYLNKNYNPLFSA